MKRIMSYVAMFVAAAALLCSPSAATTTSVATSTTAATFASPRDAWCVALAGGSPTVDALGDSLTLGDSVSDLSRRSTALLGEALRSDGAPNAQVWIGGAIGGSATADYVAGAKYSGHIEFTVNHPSVVLMGWGTNDWAGNIPVAQFSVQYQQIIDRVHTLSPDSLIVLVHMPWIYNTSLTSTRGSQLPYRDAIRALATANGAVYLAEEWGFRGDDLNQEDMPDRIHKNANGQNVQFVMMLATLRALCF